MDDAQAVELFGFLEDPRVDVRNTAAKYVAGMSGNPSLRQLFHINDFCGIRGLMPLVKDEPLTAHDAISALINLSSDSAIIKVLAREEFLTDLVIQTILPKNVNADLCCMLLNNLTKFGVVVDTFLPPVTPETKADHNAPDASAHTDHSPPTHDTNTSSRQTPTHRIDNLLEIFIRGETAKYNASATFHFLAGMFANLTATPQGAQFFLGRSTIDNTLRLSKLIVFTEHTNAIRRGGVVSAIKNCCFAAGVTKHGQSVLLSKELNLGVYLLSPLSGAEDYTDEEMEGMPEELQFPEPTKKREQDALIRLMLVECLVLLTTTREGRDYLRAIKAYFVIKKLHLVEQSEDIQEMIERVVNMIARDEDDGDVDRHDAFSGGQLTRRSTVVEDEDEFVQIESLV